MPWFRTLSDQLYLECGQVFRDNPSEVDPAVGGNTVITFGLKNGEIIGITRINCEAAFEIQWDELVCRVEHARHAEYLYTFGKHTVPIRLKRKQIRQLLELIRESRPDKQPPVAHDHLD